MSRAPKWKLPSTRYVGSAVVPASGAALSPEALHEALRGTLSSYKIPRRMVFVAEENIPRTATGKLKLHDLATLIGGQP